MAAANKPPNSLDELTSQLMGTKVGMAAVNKPLIARLADLTPGQEADFFALLTAKEELTTRDGKPYYRVAFRDERREVTFPIWNDSPWAVECREKWRPGAVYKLRAALRDTSYGPQLEIRRIREASDADSEDGYDPAMFRPRSRFDSREMYDELTAIAGERITTPGLRELVLDILQAHREQLLVWTAARKNHHAFVGGFLEHVLSVTRTCVYLADKYAQYYPDLAPPLSKCLVVAGAILHDVGKLRELEQAPEGTTYSAAGHLIGHVLQGRDIVREAAARHEIAPETLLRLEHIIVAHQRLPEWGSPKPPMTPEALIVHFADDLDAKLNMMTAILRDDPQPGPVTSRKNILGHELFRGMT